MKKKKKPHFKIGLAGSKKKGKETHDA